MSSQSIYFQIFSCSMLLGDLRGKIKYVHFHLIFNMKGNLQHIFLNVADPMLSFPFYIEFMGLLGYKIEFLSTEELGLNNGSNEIWLRKASHSGNFDRNLVGINHIAFRVSSKDEVEEFCERFIKKNHISTLFNSPRIFDSFTEDYYAVYFEDPDGIKLEITSYTFEFE